MGVLSFLFVFYLGPFPRCLSPLPRFLFLLALPPCSCPRPALTLQILLQKLCDVEHLEGGFLGLGCASDMQHTPWVVGHQHIGLGL